MLEELANKIAQTPPPPRDAEAEDFIRRRIGSRPDALYLMTQTVLIQNLALQQAQAQLEQLQRAARPGQASGAGGSFLGQQSPSGYGSQYSAPPPPQYAAPSPQAPSPQVAAPSGSPSFLRGAAQTAAGVAAGALAFEGIRSLFSHPGYGGGSGFFGGGGFGAPMEETIVNNYYDTPGPEAGAEHHGFLGNDDAGYDAGNDLGPVDDVNYDDSGSDFDDAGGGFDDSGSGDDFA